MNAAPFINNASPAYVIKNPFDANNRFGATFGGPIKKDKLFYFLSYQGMRNADAAESIQTLTVPLGLTNDRSTAGLAAAYAATTGKTIATSAIQLPGGAGNHELFSLPNGQYMIPSPTITKCRSGEGAGL